MRIAGIFLGGWLAVAALPLVGDVGKAGVILAADEEIPDWGQEVQQIDRELEQLKDLKNRYKASAARHEDEAIRWQFEQNLKQESRRAYRQAELDREMEQQIQSRIDYLQAKREQIVKEHPDAIKKSS